MNKVTGPKKDRAQDSSKGPRFLSEEMTFKGEPEPEQDRPWGEASGAGAAGSRRAGGPPSGRRRPRQRHLAREGPAPPRAAGKGHIPQKVLAALVGVGRPQRQGPPPPVSGWPGKPRVHFPIYPFPARAPRSQCPQRTNARCLASPARVPGGVCARRRAGEGLKSQEPFKVCKRKPTREGPQVGTTGA